MDLLFESTKNYGSQLQNTIVDNEHQMQDRMFRDLESARNLSLSPATSASFLARVQRLTCASRWRALENDSCSSE